MRYTFLITIILFVFIGCSKDKFTTVPQLKYKSVNNSIIHKGESLIFTLYFTDAEGDIGDSLLYVEKVSLNCVDQAIPVRYKVPEFPTTNNQEGNIEVAFSYAVTDGFYPSSPESSDCDIDTCYFRFMLRDKAQNMSDTVNSENLILIK